MFRTTVRKASRCARDVRDGLVPEPLDDLAHIRANFKMPGDGLIPDYCQRLKRTNAGINPRLFIESCVAAAFDTERSDEMNPN